VRLFKAPLKWGTMEFVKNIQTLSRHLGVLGLVLSLAWPAQAWAEGDRGMAAIAAASDGTIERLMLAPELKSEDQLYKDYFAAPDAGILRSYEDTWRYHEQQQPFEAAAWNGEFLQMGTLGTNTTQESQVRQGFAQGVMRQKMDCAFRGVFNPKNVPMNLRAKVASVQSGLNKVKHASVPLSKGGSSLRLQMGYDFFTDASKLELVSDSWGAGIYHTRLLSALSQDLTNGLVMRVSARVSKHLPTAALAYTPGAKALEGSLSSWVSRSVQATVSTVVPTAQHTFSQRYQLTLGVLF